MSSNTKSIVSYQASQLFSHTPLSATKDQIRLLKVQASQADEDPTQHVHIQICHFDLEQVGRGKAVPYKALSYVWGEEEAIHTVYVNEAPFRIRPNLYDLLLQFRSQEHSYLWIDQLCINQQDFMERNSQVQLMSSIYAQADRVYAWLGTASQNSDMVMEILQDDSVVEVPDDCSDSVTQACYREFWEHKSDEEMILRLQDRYYTSRSDVWPYDNNFYCQNYFFVAKIIR